jgi:hypothetical protein
MRAEQSLLDNVVSEGAVSDQTEHKPLKAYAFLRQRHLRHQFSPFSSMKRKGAHSRCSAGLRVRLIR